MSIGIALSLGAPIGAVVVVLAAGWALPANARRVAATAGALGALAGSTLVLAQALDGVAVASRGFDADPWRAGLGAAMSAITVAAMVGRPLGPAAGVTGLLGLAAGIVSVWSAHVAVVAGALVLTTVALAVATRAQRAPAGIVTMLAASDLLIAIGLLGASSGARAPAVPVGGSAVLLALGALARVASAGISRSMAAGAERDATVAAGTLGIVRVQGIAVAVWVALGSSFAADALTVIAAIVALLLARRAARIGMAHASLGSLAALVVVGIGVGTPGAATGAVALGIGAALGTLLLLTRAEAAAGPSLGAAPLGASLVGAVTIGRDALERGVVDRPFLVVALATITAVVWLALAGTRGSESRRRNGAPSAVVIAGLALGAVAVLTIVPGTVVGEMSGRAPSLIAGTRTLGTVPIEVPDGLGLAFVVGAAAAAGAMMAAGASPVAGNGARRREPSSGGWDPRSRGRYAWPAAGLAETAAVASVVALFIDGSTRGFL